MKTSRHPIASITVLLCIGTGITACIDHSLNTSSRTVVATAYTSDPEQTDGTPFVPACGGELVPGDRAIAISRDLKKHGLTCGASVIINGDEWTVRDVMNKRYSNRIDLYMGVDEQAARQFGKRRVEIQWRQS
ncbi:hypothetical protein VSS37_03920 [Candidatus Thiothrix sp. Deng01]|uniref:3D domain-containing protein n=1 Tax=Candidatus Thiothrix phosphatis TaxID=3112415 RepID=A0ABU6CVF4_9GAMM|nr:hypothetical protein [Candidatus Thiothrix sp. Deng01]MEB4590119.1 hypothetical protein [Candidatus Thiothrix sp. Deng01]